MGSTMQALQQLQEIELQLSELKQKIGARERAIRAQESRIAAITRETDTQRTALRSKQMEADRLNVDIKSSEERVAKLRLALNQAKTNKEYSTLLTQLNTDKADGSKVEDRALAMLEEIDAARKTVSDLEEQLSQEGQKLDEIKTQAQAYKAQIADRFAKLTTDRTSAASGIPPSVLNVFERMAERHEGQAMAMVTRTNPRREEFACGGCNMAMTLEQVNALISRDDPICCNTCGRILYLQRVGDPGR